MQTRENNKTQLRVNEVVIFMHGNSSSVSLEGKSGFHFANSEQK